MGVLIAPPEAGDASVNILPQIKKHTAISDDLSKSFVSTITERNTTDQSTLISTLRHDSINSINEDAYKHMISMKNTVFDSMSSSTIHDGCQFPYYRSSRSDSKSTDAVLVKDVGVSCMLLSENEFEMPIPETKTLVKHLKREYNDLSNITSKLTAYTKDILNHFSKKNHGKHQLFKDLTASKHAMASQYVDSKGNLCLKLRLFSNAETQCAAQQFVKNLENKSSNDKDTAKKLLSNYSKNKVSNGYETTARNKHAVSKYEKQVQAVIEQENAETNTSNNSTTSSASSTFHYLTVRRKKTSNELTNTKLMRFNDIRKYETPKRFNHETKSCKEHCRKRSTVILTNWKEISKLKHSKNKALSITSNESQQTVNVKNKGLQEEFVDYNTISNTPNTKFHTVNIRIIQKNKKPV